MSVCTFAGPKEDLLNLRNETHLLLVKERIKLIKGNADLSILHNNIIRTHGKLAHLLKNNPELKKNSKLKEPELSKFKLKLMMEDEDLSELRVILVKMHRKLEYGLLKDARIQSLSKRVKALDLRLTKMR